MNKKKLIIIILSIVACLLIAGLVLFFILKDDDKNEKKGTKEVSKITITFDADGGEKVEDMKVTKGSSFQLPETTKEGFTFAGWYNGDKLITDDDTDKLTKNIVLTAKWKELEEDDIVMNITFDSKGGSKVNSMTVKCTDGTAVIKSLPKPKKDSYNFMSWEDKHGKSILKGAKLTCEENTELKLYAIWEYDGPVANPEQDPTPTTTVKEKEYKCPTGYELKDKTKCVQFAEKVTTCETGKYSEKADKCYAWYSNPTKVCTPYKGYQEGKYFDDTHGHYGCAYGSLDSYPTNTTCSGHGTWSDYAPAPHCYAHVVTGNSNVSNQCPEGKSYESSTTLGGTQNSGCYTLTNPTKKCPAGYTNASVYGGCAKIVEATLE